MTPEQAKAHAEIKCEQIPQEWAITRKVLEAVAETHLDYRPDPKARGALDLCWHIVASELWFMESLLAGEFGMEEPARPPEIRTPRDAIAWYEQRAPDLLRKIQAVPGERWVTPVSFFGLYNFPLGLYLEFLVVHSVHHRGQLSTYLRPMGARVPAIYGGSADEPFEIPDHS